MPYEYNKKELLDILSKNSGRDFVQRIVKKKTSPVLTNDDGSVSTHSMVVGSSDNHHFVYPTVIREGDKLRRLSDDEASSHAMKNKEYIKFNKDEFDKAEAFSKQYKKIWE